VRVLLGFPILRLLATTGSSPSALLIARIVFENWKAVWRRAGDRRVAPRLFGLEMGTQGHYLSLLPGAGPGGTDRVRHPALQHSRLGRAWVALREDEIACAAMGVDVARTKLTAYAAALLAGLVG